MEKEMQALSAKPQKWQAAQRAYQDYRAGERQAYAQPSTAMQDGSKPWWQRGWEWFTQNPTGQKVKNAGDSSE